MILIVYLVSFSSIGFIDEALLMKNFNHEHVLGILGLSEGDRGPLVVLPFMEEGDLLSYVKDVQVVGIICLFNKRIYFTFIKQ